jgi:FKBP-type peptidyl-prolyl cis-trans isomerase FkpA
MPCFRIFLFRFWKNALNNKLIKGNEMKKSLVLAVGLIFCASSFAADVVKLPSGVEITQITQGVGETPKATSAVTVHYRGTLTNGTEFDSSYGRGQPATFTLDRVIPCWTQALQTIKVGGKATITCPAKTAYGANGIAGVIPPNAVLKFDVELLKIMN